MDSPIVFSGTTKDGSSRRGEGERGKLRKEEVREVSEWRP
jgi:hypothetical protein